LIQALNNKLDIKTKIQKIPNEPNDKARWEHGANKVIVKTVISKIINYKCKNQLTKKSFFKSIFGF